MGKYLPADWMRPNPTAQPAAVEVSDNDDAEASLIAIQVSKQIGMLLTNAEIAEMTRVIATALAAERQQRDEHIADWLSKSADHISELPAPTPECKENFRGRAMALTCASQLIKSGSWLDFPAAIRARQGSQSDG